MLKAPKQTDFTRINAWVFDLDNTLYSPHSTLFPQIHARMDDYIMRYFAITPEEASERRTFYFHEYGTSLRGLMLEEHIDPDHFLDYCHDVDLGVVTPDEKLTAAIANLPGQKFIFTNADRRHAARILERLALQDHFEGIFDIEDGKYICKPQRAAYETFLKKHAVKADASCMFEDMEVNLLEAHQLGMTTVWLRHEAAWLRKLPRAARECPHCHHVVEDLAPFLASIMEPKT